MSKVRVKVHPAGVMPPNPYSALYTKLVVQLVKGTHPKRLDLAEVNTDVAIRLIAMERSALWN